MVENPHAQAKLAFRTNSVQIRLSEQRDCRPENVNLNSTELSYPVTVLFKYFLINTVAGVCHDKA